jgi:hypothetical protein
LNRGALELSGIDSIVLVIRQDKKSFRRQGLRKLREVFSYEVVKKIETGDEGTNYHL